MRGLIVASSDGLDGVIRAPGASELELLLGRRTYDLFASFRAGVGPGRPKERLS